MTIVTAMIFHRIINNNMNLVIRKTAISQEFFGNAYAFFFMRGIEAAHHGVRYVMKHTRGHCKFSFRPKAIGKPSRFFGN